ncbi:precorrin-6A synthase (deacetylating) [Microlunatus aurantiacus]|uniref:Precorrin-6A synthase (Deacetylating) n=1 Tax=Microlunatus aurantiacus TaxID=446786 RepID=A0ABP7D8K6_9ACTN
MITVLAIGIGSGSPAHLTAEAAAALNRVDVFLVADKRAETSDLAAIRTDLCRAVITGHNYRVIEVADPARDRDPSGYREAVADWHARRARAYADVITRELPDGGTLGFLVWGDPALYDSTLRIVEQIRASGVDLALEVYPGISSVQLLAARHQMVLNTVGGPIYVTTGRRLVDEFRPDLGTVVVMLDGDLACGRLVEEHPDLEIWWGAQLGLADEALIHGRLRDVLPGLTERRSAIRAERGWVMDVYALRTAD